MRKLLLLCLLIISYSFSHAQMQTIKVYRAVIKAEGQRHTGVLEKVNKNGVTLEKRNRKRVVIPSEQIKTIRIKPSRETRTITIPTLEPRLIDRNHDGTLTDAYLQNTPSLGEEIGHAVATVATTMIFDAAAYSLQSLKKFKINYKKESYFDIVHELGMYSIYYQASPEYEAEALKALTNKNHANKSL